MQKPSLIGWKRWSRHWPVAERWKPNLTPERLQRLIVPTELDLRILVLLLRPEVKSKGLLVAVDDRGKEAVLSDPVVQECSKAGWALLGVDPRAIGEMKTTKNNWLFAISLVAGENLVWRQAWDIARAVQGVASTDEFRSLPGRSCPMPGKPVQQSGAVRSPPAFSPCRHGKERAVSLAAASCR